MIDTLVLIDSKNLCYRAHWVHRFLSSRGRPTSVLFGFLKMLKAVASHLPNAAFVFVWDGKGRTWRHELTKGTYKGNRQGPNEEMAPAFPQIPILQKALRAAGFRQFEYDNLECDDLIGILATSAREKDLFKFVVIYSTDRDFYQLVTNRIGVTRGHFEEDGMDAVLFTNEIIEETGLPPKEWVKVRALTGDPTDNIPNIAKGVGPKTAVKMIQAGLDTSVEEFAKLPWAVRQNFQVLASQWGKVRRNYELSKIITQPLDKNLPEELREPLTAMVESLDRNDFLRDPKKLSDESFEEFTNFLLEYEMQELFGMRRELWKLP